MIQNNQKKKLVLSEVEFLTSTGIWCFINSVLINNILESQKSVFINKFFIKHSNFFKSNLKNKIKFPLKSIHFNKISELNIQVLPKLVCYYKKIFLYFIKVNFLNSVEDIFYSLTNFFSSFIILFSIYNEIKN